MYYRRNTLCYSPYKNMRTIVNVSLPESLRLYMVKRSKESGYGSVSEYVRDLVRTDQEKYLAKIDEQIDRESRYFRERAQRRY